MKAALTILVLLFSLDAQASVYVIACGEGRARGPKEAEMSFVDNIETMPKFYLRGEEFSDEKFAFNGVENGWVFTLFGEPARRDRRFDVDLSNNTMQEYVVSKDGVSKEVGKKKKCSVTGP